jgi:HK97 family phage major capsid protein
MNQLKHLKEERAKIQEQLDAIFSLCEKEKRSRTEDELKKYTELVAKEAEFTKEIEDLEKHEERKKALAANQPPVSFDAPGKEKFSDKDKKEIRNYKMGKALSALAEERKLDGLEAEVNAEAIKERTEVKGAGFNSRGLYIPSWLIQFEKRDVTIGTESGDIMQTTLGSLIPILAPKTVCAKLGVNFITGLTGDYQRPRVSGAPSFAWQTEQGASTETTPTFDNWKMTPKRVSAYLEWSNQAQIQASFGLEGELRKLLNQYLGIQWDSKALQGDGTSNTPTGILYTSGVGSVSFGATDGGAPTWAKMVEFQSDIETANAPDGAIAYVSTPVAKAKLMSTPRQSSGVEGNFIMNNPNECIGYPFVSTNQMPATLTEGGSGAALSGLIFGNFNEANIGFFGGLNLIYDNITGATTGTQRLYIEQFLDVKLNHPASFSVSVDMITQ